MKVKTIAAVATAALFLAACDDNTEGIGFSLTSPADQISISTDTFEVTTQSIITDSVYSRNTIGYLGNIRDPETGAYITCDFMSQFHTLEDFEFPEIDKVRSLDSEGKVIADSCDLRLYFDTFYGDTLASMKVGVFEMSRPMLEDRIYYTNFDPMEEGYVRNDGLRVDKSYTLTDLNSTLATRSMVNYVRNIHVVLTDKYTDAEGNVYNNFGTYIMRKYYENPKDFKNSIYLTRNVLPGLYMKSLSGLGAMVSIYATQLNIYFSYEYKDSVYNGSANFSGTEEVLQTSYIQNDKSAIRQLAEDKSCTYLKTPAGIFTEMTIPVEQVLYKHENDSITTAKVSLQRINNDVRSKYSLETPSAILMIPKDRMYSFFENKEVPDYKTSFLATYDKTTNSYTFNNIAGMIHFLNNRKNNGDPDWNKVVLIPVTVSYSTSTASSGIYRVVNDMSMSSTKLVGGPENKNGKIKLSVIYTKFKE